MTIICAGGGALAGPTHFLVMRACFLGQNVCALGYGVATLQIPPLTIDDESVAKAGETPQPDPLLGVKPVKRLAAGRPESVKFR